MLPGHVNLMRLRAESASVLQSLRRAGIRDRELFGTTLSKAGRMPTATWGNILYFGRNFISGFKGKKLNGFSVKIAPSNFESAISISLFRGAGNKLFSAKVGFDEKAVVVEALEGISPSDESSPDAALVTKWVTGRHGAVRQFEMPVNRHLEEFRRLSGFPALNFLLREIEAVAKATGYTQVRIRRPETLFWIKSNSRDKGFMEESERIKRMYYGAAKKEGYSRNSGFLVKNI